MRSSAIFFVSVVTRTRWSFSARAADLLDQVVDLALASAGPRPPGRSGRWAGRSAPRPRSETSQLVRPGRRGHEHDLAARAPGTPRSGAAGCRSRSAAGSRTRRASTSATGRPRTSRGAAARSRATRRSRRGSRRGSSRAACTARSPALASVEVARVVLDARAEADLAQHLEVVARPHPQPLGLEQLALRLELREALVAAPPRSSTSACFIRSSDAT